MNNNIKIIFALILSMASQTVIAQELTQGILQNAQINITTKTKQHKTRAIILPFIDDFSTTQVVPNINNWTDAQAYINNSFSLEPITKGIATLDALNAQGNSYYPNGASAKYYADSLTSEVINLQGKQASDSIYLSFYYQAQGLGFAPEVGDSLNLYFLTNTGTWIKMWGTPGAIGNAWQQKILAVTAVNFLHNNFQFRFVNIASPNSNDDVWNIDYVRLAANRTRLDTSLNDVAFVNPPSSIFANYTAMPLKHFINFTSTEQAGNFAAYVKNNSNINYNKNVYVQSRQQPLNSILASDSFAINITPNVSETADYNLYNTTSIVSNTNNIKHTYYLKASANISDLKSNDTIISNHALNNYFAYDDGSAEKAYYLFAAPNMPASTALQFHLNTTDSIYGLAIRFGGQVPSAQGKLFNIALYKSLGANSSTQQLLLQENFYTVQYTNDREGFTYYKFTEPKLLDSGIYYIGTTQVANTSSDTIYFGIDANTNANPTKLFYNVDGTWKPSGTIGSIMLRPIVGATFIPTNVANNTSISSKIVLYPNPAKNNLQINTDATFTNILILNSFGNVVAQYTNHKNLNISNLPSGKYFLQLVNKNKILNTNTFIKQ